MERLTGGRLKMRDLSEVERDEIEAIKHYVKYVITKPNVEDYKIWDAILKLEDMSKKYVLSGIIKEKELNELFDLDDSKELVQKLFSMLCKHIGEDKFNEIMNEFEESLEDKHEK